jgi:hypothetical protein
MAEPLAGDALVTALIPAAQALIDAVHALDADAVNAALGTAMWEATGPLAGLRHLAVLLAAMCSEDHAAPAALGWTVNPAEYHRLRSSADALTASLRAGRTTTEQGGA